MPIWLDRTKQPIRCEWHLDIGRYCRHLAIGWYRFERRRDDLPAMALCAQHLAILAKQTTIEIRQVSGPTGN